MSFGKIENLVRHGANIDAGDSFALDASTNGLDYLLFYVNADGVIKPYEDKEFPSIGFSDLKTKGVDVPGMNYPLSPGKSISLTIAGREVKVTANDKVGITLNGEPATPYTRELERKRFGHETDD